MKIFCSCLIEFVEDEELNICVCFVCFGLLGVFLVFNEVVVELVVKIGKVLNVDIVEDICFYWKNYYYFDLFKNF